MGDDSSDHQTNAVKEREEKQMKKIIILFITLLFLSIPAVETEDISFIGPMEAPMIEMSPRLYTINHCRYYVSAMPSINNKANAIITPNGEEWIYETEEISGVSVYDGMPVTLIANDMGTASFKDDNIVPIFDRETAIYDELYDRFSENENWIVTRNGNHIHIDVKGE